jgi:hypothetical protein
VAFAAAPQQPQSQEPPVQQPQDVQVHEEHVQSVQAQASPQQQGCFCVVPVVPSMEAERTRERAKPVNMRVSFWCAGADAPAGCACETSV